MRRLGPVSPHSHSGWTLSVIMTGGNKANGRGTREKQAKWDGEIVVRWSALTSSMSGTAETLDNPGVVVT